MKSLHCLVSDRNADVTDSGFCYSGTPFLVPKLDHLGYVNHLKQPANLNSLAQVLAHVTTPAVGQGASSPRVILVVWLLRSSGRLPVMYDVPGHHECEEREGSGLDSIHYYPDVK